MAKKTTPKKGAAKKSAAKSPKSSPAAKAGKKSPPSPPKKAVAVSRGKAAPKPPIKAKPAPQPKPSTAPPIKAKPVAKAKPALITIPPPTILAPEVPPPLSLTMEPFTAPKLPPPGSPLSVSVQSSQGMAANGNTHPANLLVIITCGGWPVTELSKDHFTLMEHFEVPGQGAPFSNNITSFRNAGTGAYLLQLRPINGAPWRSGHHLGQLLISTAEDQQGQAAFKLIIR